MIAAAAARPNEDATIATTAGRHDEKKIMTIATVAARATEGNERNGGDDERDNGNEHDGGDDERDGGNERSGGKNGRKKCDDGNEHHRRTRV